MSKTQLVNGILYREAVANVDDEKVLSLYRSAFNEEFSLEWFRWFNYSCPLGKNRLYVAEDQTTSHIVGSFGLLPYKIKFNDKLIDGSLASNLCTHPDYQRRGIFLNVVKFALATEKIYRSKISLSVPNQNSSTGLAALNGYLKVGFEILGDLDFIVSYHHKAEKFRAVKVDKFTERFDSIIATTVKRMKFAIYKDHRFLKWRYFDRPGKEYHVYAYQDKTKVLGFIVLKYYEDKDYKKTHILDMYAFNEDIFDDLLNVARNFAFERNCNELNCWQMGNSPYLAHFYRRGFEPSANKYALIATNNFGVKEALVSHDWWFMLGDNDVY